MKNFVQNGATITLTAPYNVASGAPILINSIFGIACHDANIKEPLEVKLTGVFTFTKLPSQNFQAGDVVYFDDKAKSITSIATGNRLIGVAIEVGSNKVNVRLNGVFGTAATSEASSTKAP